MRPGRGPHEVVLCLGLQGPGAYAIVDGRVLQADGARIKAIGRERRRGRHRVGTAFTFTRAVHGLPQGGHTRQWRHFSAGGGGVARGVAIIGAGHRTDAVAEDREAAQGACSRGNNSQASHVERCRLVKALSSSSILMSGLMFGNWSQESSRVSSSA